ncbi:hypothetical protein [Pedobacter heparinus]|uniref:hypothetical protein n=1 Tax=Pedobacter heparinus TaxID=984 RepID=UPI002930963C|nr:hypothetical protein [Pedobacter heparinus]
MRRNECCKSIFNRSQELIMLSLCITLILSVSLPVASQDLGKGFFDHGIASPHSSAKGIVATVDGKGHHIALVWLFDHRGGYALLMIDAETGKSEQFPVPIPVGDYSYSSILSSKNKFYTLFNSHFVEFDPIKKKFTFTKNSLPQMAMGMTEDDQGVIWAVTYPNSGLVSFNPNTREYKDHGYVYKQNWLQYQRFIAADDTGWIYFGLGFTASQIIAYDPASGRAKPMFEEAERERGSAYVYRDLNGKVYGQALQDSSKDWYEFYKGNRRKIGKQPTLNIKPIITGTQNLFHRDFPDGRKIRSLDLVERKLVIEDPKTAIKKEVSFEYTGDGSWTMGVGVSPDGTISGGASFPMRAFSYDARINKWANREAFGQFNAITHQGDRFYFGVYPNGSLLEWDPSKPWINTQKNKAGTNPLFLTACTPTIHRPGRLLAYPDDKTIIMSGTPEYGYTGGGLLFWDREKKDRILLTDTSVIIDQSTISLVPLAKGLLLGGTTTEPGTGGEKKAKEAEVYIMDMASKKLLWHKALFPGVQEYTDMTVGKSGLIYGITDRKKFFVFDPVKKLIVHEKETTSYFGLTTYEQSPRVFVRGKDGAIYLLFVKGIVKVNPVSFEMTMIAESPAPIDAGGDYLDGRIYFISGSHLLSYVLPVNENYQPAAGK